MDYGSIFQSILGVIAGIYTSLMAMLGKAKPVIAFSTGLVFALIAGYVCLKWFELLGETEGQSISQRVFLAYKQFRKQFVVYVLVVAAPFICAAFAGIAKGQVQKCFTLMNALDGVAAQADGGIKSIVQSWPSIQQGVAAATGITDQDFNAANRSLEIRNVKASPEAKAARKTLADATDKMSRDIKALGNPPSGSPAASRKALLESAVQRNQNLLQAGDQALQSISPEEKERWNQYMQATNDAANESTLSIVGKSVGIGAATVAGGKIGGAGVAGGTLGTAIYGADIKELILKGVVYALAGIVALIAIAAVGSLGLTVVKQGTAILSYIVGVWTCVSVGAAIATPVAGLFMLTFLSDKLESYGRNFVSFWFSMVFGTIGMATMAVLLAQVIRTAMPLCIAPGMQAIVGFAGANTWMKILMGLLTIFGFFFAAGSLLSFLASLFRKGLGIGTGFWTGTFSA